jgi:hypothetical protein
MAPRVGEAANFFCRLHDQFWISEFIDEFHIRVPALADTFLLQIF